MNKEKIRQEHNRELEEKEQEIEDMRASSQKKVRYLSRRTLACVWKKRDCATSNKTSPHDTYILFQSDIDFCSSNNYL